MEPVRKNCIPNFDDATKAHLQANSGIGTAYAEASRTTYFYRLNWYNHDVEAAKKGVQIDGRKMGYATVVLYASGSEYVYLEIKDHKEVK